MPLFGPKAEKIALGGDAHAELVWTTEVHGTGSHSPTIRPDRGSLYFGDGMGCYFSSMRFRRYDLARGNEVARCKSYNTVRTAFFEDDLDRVVIAQDNRIVRLDAISLEEVGRWDRRIPAYTDSMAISGDLAVLANWVKPSVGLLELSTGKVRHRPVGPLPVVLGGYSCPLVLERYDGGLRSVDPKSGALGLLLETPPCHDGRLDPSGKAIWLTVGTPARIGKDMHNPHVLGPGREVRRYSLERSEPPHVYELPAAAKFVHPGTAQIWFRNGSGDSGIELGDGDSYLVAVPLPVGSGPARILRAAEGEVIVAVHPDARLVLTRRSSWEEDTSTFSLLRLCD